MALVGQNSSGIPTDTIPFAPGYPKVWGSESYTLKFSQRVKCISCSLPSNKLLAVTSGRDVEIYNAQTFKLVDTLSGHDQDVDVVKFLDENILASGDGIRSGTVIIWRLDDEGKNVNNSKKIPMDIGELAAAAADTVLEHIRKKDDVGTESDGQDRTDLIATLTPAITSYQRQYLRRLEITYNAMLFGFNSDSWLHGANMESDSNAIDSAMLVCKTGDHNKFIIILQLTFSQDEREVQTSDLRESIKTYQPAPEDQATDQVIWSGTSPDGTMLAVVSWDQHVRIYATPQPLTKTSQAASIKLLYKIGPTGGQNWTGAWHQSSKYFAFSQGSPKTVVYVYRIPFTDKNESEPGQPELIHSQSAFSGWCRSMAWSPDGKTLLCAAENKVLLYDPFSSTVEREFSYVPERRSTDEIGGSKVSRRTPLWIEAGNAQWISQARCLWTAGDLGIEMFDRNEELRYRWGPGEKDKWSQGYWSSQVVFAGGKMISADGDNVVRVWDLPGQEDSQKSIK